MNIATVLNEARQAEHDNALARLSELIDISIADRLTAEQASELNDLAGAIGLADSVLDAEIARRTEIIQLGESLAGAEEVERQLADAEGAADRYRAETAAMVAKREPEQARLNAVLPELRKAAGKLRVRAERRRDLVDKPGPIESTMTRQIGSVGVDEDTALARCVAIANAQTAEEIARQKRSRQVRKGQGVSEEAAYRRAVEVAGIESRQVAARRAQRAGG